MQDTIGTSSYYDELKVLFPLAVPLAAAFAGNQLMGLVDTAIVGRLGAVEIAAAGLGNALFFGASVFGMGVVMGLDPLIAQAIGAKKEGKAKKHLHDAFWLTIILCIPLIIISFLGLLVLPLLKIELQIQEHSFYYLLGRSPGLLPFLLYTAQRSYLQAIDQAKSVMNAMIIANILNLPLSVYLTFGDSSLHYLGLPGLGLTEGWGVFGAGLATSVVTCFQVWFLVRAMRSIPSTKHEKKKLQSASWFTQPSSSGLISIFKVGWPIGVQLLAEVGIFVVITLFMGSYGAESLGGHQVALQVASFTFMLCLGISNATSVRVGHAIGRQDQSTAKRAGFVGILLGISAMSVSALSFWLFPELIISLFAKPKGVILAAIPLLQIAAVFQIFDGIQAISAGALRGAGDTKIPLVANLVGHWLFGFPIALFASHSLHLGPRGLWWGLTSGLFFVSLFLSARFWWLTKNKITPLQAPNATAKGSVKTS